MSRNSVFQTEASQLFIRKSLNVTRVGFSSVYSTDQSNASVKNTASSEIYMIPTAAAKSLQSCPALWDPIDGSPPGSSISGILQASILEWVASSFSNACMQSYFSRVWLCATLWTAAHQAPPSTGFSRQEYWSGLPFPSPTETHTH